jgi:hypothetical protein
MSAPTRRITHVYVSADNSLLNPVLVHADLLLVPGFIDEVLAHVSCHSVVRSPERVESEYITAVQRRYVLATPRDNGKESIDDDRRLASQDQSHAASRESLAVARKPEQAQVKHLLALDSKAGSE